MACFSSLSLTANALAVSKLYHVLNAANMAYLNVRIANWFYHCKYTFTIMKCFISLLFPGKDNTCQPQPCLQALGPGSVYRDYNLATESFCYDGYF